MARVRRRGWVRAGLEADVRVAALMREIATESSGDSAGRIADQYGLDKSEAARMIADAQAAHAVGLG